jgi:benzylsuccinate CoA-transferase BbsF subunit
MGALIHRKKTGQGLWIDLAMYQVGAVFMGEGILEYVFNGQRQRPLGNGHLTFSPHGCFPCRGNDQWLVLAIQSDDQWKRLCLALGQPSMAEDPRYADPSSRYRRRDEINTVISLWTRGRDKYEAMHLLQSAGVPCGPVLKSSDLFSDPQFKDRGYFEVVQHSGRSGVGKRAYPSRGWRFSGLNLEIRRPGPSLGEDNQYVLHDLLGIGLQEIGRLEEAQVIGRRPLAVEPPTPLPLERQKALGWIMDYDRHFRQVMDLE